MLICLLLLGALAWAVKASWSYSIPNAGKFTALALGAVILLVLVREFVLVRMLNYRNSYLQIAGALLMCTLGWIVFYPYLKWIDPLYVNWGSDYRKG
jgi:membrane protein YdbS with pleckstrin-like domain